MKLIKSTTTSRNAPRGSAARPLLAPANVRLGTDAPFVPGRLWTDDELLELGSDTDTKYELWNGRIIGMPPAGLKHGAVIARLMVAIGSHAYEHRLGEVFDGQTGFRLSIDHCFEPDISFISRERMKLVAPLSEKLFHGSPNLAVEVLSPSDSITKTERKMKLYLVHGSHLAWMIDPKTKTARIYRPNGESELLRGDQMLVGNSVLSGFRISLGRLFAEI